MGEYENWLKRKEAEEAENARRARSASNRSDFTPSRQEMPPIIEMTADRVQAVMQEALREEFRRAKQSTFKRIKNLTKSTIQSPHITVVAMWGEKLGLTPAEKELVNGKFQFRKPHSILEFDYNSINMDVYENHLEDGLSGHISLEHFSRDKSVIFADIRRQIQNPNHSKETLSLQGNTYQRVYYDNGQPGSPSWYDQR